MSNPGLEVWHDIGWCIMGNDPSYYHAATIISDGSGDFLVQKLCMPVIDSVVMIVMISCCDQPFKHFWFSPYYDNDVLEYTLTMFGTHYNKVVLLMRSRSILSYVWDLLDMVTIMRWSY